MAINTVTNLQIKRLRDEARLAGDVIMADICDVALSSEDSDGTGTVLGKPLTVADARAECARVIADTEAMVVERNMK